MTSHPWVDWPFDSETSLSNIEHQALHLYAVLQHSHRWAHQVEPSVQPPGGTVLQAAATQTARYMAPSEADHCRASIPGTRLALPQNAKKELHLFRQNGVSPLSVLEVLSHQRY
jgi:hypothetical protein